jgi:hypothetical protein
MGNTLIEIMYLISNMQSAGATVACQWEDEAQRAGRVVLLTVTITGAVGIPEKPMSPGEAAEHMRVWLRASTKGRPRARPFWEVK